jgi:hypothetical protein
MPQQSTPSIHGNPDSAAQHVDAGKDKPAPGGYPPVRRDDSVDTSGGSGSVGDERRSFEGDVESAESDRSSRDPDSDSSMNQGHTGPRGDPAEGKR